MRIHEVSRLGDSPYFLGQLKFPLCRKLPYFTPCPNVEFPLCPLTVCILGRCQPSPFHPQVSLHVFSDPSDHVPRPLLSYRHPQLRIQPHQLGIVVEHLFEMRYRPLPVHCVSMKATPNLIVDPTHPHRSACMLHYLQKLLTLFCIGPSQ